MEREQEEVSGAQEANLVKIILPVSQKTEAPNVVKSKNGRRPFSMRADVVKKTILRHFKKALLDDYDEVAERC